MRISTFSSDKVWMEDWTILFLLKESPVWVEQSTEGPLTWIPRSISFRCMKGRTDGSWDSKDANMWILVGSEFWKLHSSPKCFRRRWTVRVIGGRVGVTFSWFTSSSLPNPRHFLGIIVAISSPWSSSSIICSSNSSPVNQVQNYESPLSFQVWSIHFHSKRACLFLLHFQLCFLLFLGNIVRIVVHKVCVRHGQGCGW